MKKLGFGLMRLPLLDQNDAGSIDIEETKRMVDTFLEKGFTYFDTAWMYCAFKSEEATKTALVERHPRDSFTLADKLHAGFIETKEDRDRIFNEQLRKTGAEYFDYYLLHDVGTDHYKKYTELDCFTWLKDKKEKGLVNLFAPTTVSYADQKEMERMLHNIGVEVNYIPFYSSLEKIKRIPAAEASTSICKVFADEFMKTLWEDYEIPYSHTVMPIGIRNTEKWYRGIAKVLGKEEEVEEIIAKERERIMPLVQKLRDRLQGKRVFICGGTGRSFAAAALIDDFGMELVGLETPTYDEDAQTDIEYLNGIHKDFVVDIANMQPFEQVNLVNKLKPDAFIGVPDWAAKLGIPTTHVLDGKRPTMGYDGLIYLGNKIADQLQNPGFNVKLAQHSKLPYKDSWYEQDAFKYIKK
mgnify:CR=1 FL=1